MKHTLMICLCFTILISAFSENYKGHYLKEGETLWSVCRKYNVSLDQLCKVNNIKDPSKISYGIVLKIPGETTQVHKGTDYIIHYLQEGETLWSLSRKYNTSLEVICSINNIKDPTYLREGFRLKIPAGTSTNSAFLDYSVPLTGTIKPFVTYHFRGILIFTTGSDKNVRSIDKGIVSFVDRVPGYGITIYIKHKNGYISTYSGFDKIYVNMHEEVRRDQTIGIAGMLSRYDKPGLLFSIVNNNKGLKFDMTSRKFVKQ